MNESMHPEPMEELREVLTRAVQRRDAAARIGNHEEAARLAEVTCQLTDEIQQTEQAAREKRRDEIMELDRMLVDHPKPYFRGPCGWR